MHPITAASVFVIMAVVSGIAAAQPPSSQPSSSQPTAAPPAAAAAAAGSRNEAMAKLQAADTDKDGKWSRAEWLAAGRRDRGFDFIDADQDGFVTFAEIQGGVQRLGGTQKPRASRSAQ
jgi:hypothetical protein